LDFRQFFFGELAKVLVDGWILVAFSLTKYIIVSIESLE
jgi:hypothetical protein